MTSGVRRTLLGAVDVAALLPKGARRRRDKRTWRLAIQLTDDHVFLFNAPVPEFLRASAGLPATYVRLVSALGTFGFSRFSGRTIWPNLIWPTSKDVERALRDAAMFSPVMAFYDHGTGDYDCWVGGSYTAVWSYDHEDSTLVRYSTGGLVGWFEKRFGENLPGA
jgi:hypothetical protein